MTKRFSSFGMPGRDWLEFGTMVGFLQLNRPMIDQIEEMLRAGAWLGPAVLGALCYRLMSHAGAAGSDDIPGAVMLGTSCVVLTAAGKRASSDRHAALGPLVFAAMFLASWSLR